MSVGESGTFWLASTPERTSRGGSHDRRREVAAGCRQCAVRHRRRRLDPRRRQRAHGQRESHQRRSRSPATGGPRTFGRRGGDLTLFDARLEAADLEILFPSPRAHPKPSRAGASCMEPVYPIRTQRAPVSDGPCRTYPPAACRYSPVQRRNAHQLYPREPARHLPGNGSTASDPDTGRPHAQSHHLVPFDCHGLRGRSCSSGDPATRWDMVPRRDRSTGRVEEWARRFCHRHRPGAAGLLDRSVRAARSPPPFHARC